MKKRKKENNNKKTKKTWSRYLPETEMLASPEVSGKTKFKDTQII